MAVSSSVDGELSSPDAEHATRTDDNAMTSVRIGNESTSPAGAGLGYAGAHVRGSLAAFALVVLAGCGQQQIFACNEDAMCDASPGGICEPNSWCSYPDDECPSGQRYGDLSANGIAGTCVPLDDTSTAGDGSATATTMASASADSGATSLPVDGSGTDATATGPSADTSTGGPPSQCPDWWDCDWGQRRVISIDAGVLTEDLVDFPIPVALDDAAADAGQALAFVDAGGTTLPFEIEEWTEGASGIVWVRVPLIVGGAVTEIEAYFGQPSVGLGEPVWDDGFVAVWHFTGLFDSTPTNNDLTDSGSMDAAGRFGRGRAFASGGGQLTAAPNASLANMPTEGMFATAWLNLASANGSGTGRILDKGDDLDATAGFVWKVDNLNAPYSTTLDVGGPMEAEWLGGAGSASFGQWHHFAIFHAHDPAGPQMWVDGVEVSVSSAAAGGDPAADDAAIPVTIGNSTYGNYFLDGTVDELRITRGPARSAAWISAEFLAGTGQLVSVGPLQTAPRP